MTQFMRTIMVIYIFQSSNHLFLILYYYCIFIFLAPPWKPAYLGVLVCVLRIILYNDTMNQ